MEASFHAAWMLSSTALASCRYCIFTSLDFTLNLNILFWFKAKKYTFKPDKMNSFEIQSDADAHADRQAEILHMNNKFK